jgi:hypothetical protein
MTPPTITFGNIFAGAGFANGDLSKLIRCGRDMGMSGD